MAVIKVKARKQANFFLPVLERELIAPFVVTVMGQDAFDGALGDTVNLKIQGLKAVARDYTWRTRTGPIVLDDIGGGASMPVKLDKHVYSATELTDEHMRLDDVNFAQEVLLPQVTAVADSYEAKVVTGLRGIKFKHTLAISETDDCLLVAAEARRLMDSDKVAPKRGRFFLIGSDIAAAWGSSDRVTRYDSTGEPGAYRDAIVGQLAGATVIEHSGLDPDEGYYIQKGGLIVANVVPRVPTGAVTGNSGLSKNGVGVRWIQDYDAAYLRDRSIVSTFLGVNDVRDERNADGSWIFEQADMTEEDYEVATATQTSPTAYGSLPASPVAAGARRNVRVLRLDASGFGPLI